MTNESQTSVTIDDLRERLKGDRTAMLTTIDERGTLSSRPLSVQTYNDHGDVFFLVGRDGEWVGNDGEAANASIVDSGSTWLSISGRLRFSDDPKLIDELWDDTSAEYFPNGKSDAIVAFVQSDRWEYWTAPTVAVQVFEFVKAKLTDHPVDLASSGTIET